MEREAVSLCKAAESEAPERYWGGLEGARAAAVKLVQEMVAGVFPFRKVSHTNASNNECAQVLSSKQCIARAPLTLPDPAFRKTDVMRVYKLQTDQLSECKESVYEGASVLGYSKTTLAP